MNGFIAVHVGAGLHSDCMWSSYKATCRNACKKALEILHQGCDSTTGVAAAVEVLENCPTTNAGVGSSISLNHTIECDASVMDGGSLNFGSVGAMPYVKNPVQVARKIAEGQHQGLSFNRVPPCTLVGEGATRWAESEGFYGRANLFTQEAEASFVKYYNLMKSHELETYRAYSAYQRSLYQTGSNTVHSFYNNRSSTVVQEYNADPIEVPHTPSPPLSDTVDSVELISPPAKRLKASEVVAFSEDANQDAECLRVPPKPSEASLFCHNDTVSDTEVQEWEVHRASPVMPRRSPECILLDTVGAVCVDSSGNISAAVSSGGIVLKSSGRVGQAGVYGAGCWAQNSLVKNKPGIGTSVTGVGEYLMKTMFAKECYHALYDSDDCISSLSDVLRKGFMESPFLKNVTSTRLAGVLGVQHYAEDNRCQVSWAHNTQTMILGYGSTSSKKTVEIVSVLPEGATVGESIGGGEKCVRFN